MKTKRPSRAELEALIHKHSGQVKRLAEALGVSRPTAYKWIYQHGLDRVVGISTLPAIDQVNVDDGKHTKGYVNPSAGRRSILVGVSTQPASPTTERKPRVARTVSVRPDLWRRTKVRAAETDRDAADVVEEALELLFAQGGER